MMSEHVKFFLEAKVNSGYASTLEPLMKEMVAATSLEDGTLGYDWFVSDDGNSFMVNESYKDANSFRIHLETFAKFSDRFLEAFEIQKIVVYSGVTPELKEIMADFNPIYLTQIGGLTK